MLAALNLGWPWGRRQRAVLDALAAPLWRRGADLGLIFCNAAYAGSKFGGIGLTRPPIAGRSRGRPSGAPFILVFQREHQ